ncbi:hypothetical protein PFICI_11073 [Pestalotiopsis fici W106-1]|uniref:DUF7708 domain-containing protein n=1 Tax=Pestalotiopsis fici (strain W106-1 / CGMCC3.15140) TaxID=1229662 RepID=W3WTR1_PESFW|nr:uncharacterized protein PFICI_11073 [Pestalotiopsis fici W106-1]ETS77199.1 hypothetical protein PFICI_11073 [Pestalotiopsis fici W106-1]
MAATNESTHQKTPDVDPLSLWTTNSQLASSHDPFEPARTAFEEGVKIFGEKLTKDVKKKHLAQQILESCTLQDVVQAVDDAKRRSEEKHGPSRVYKSLVSFSQKLLHYGKVVDVLVSHHPEYVALVWGAMKFVFGAVMEHERTAVTVVTGLSEIAGSLASVELAIMLYPHEIMRRAVSMLYAHIIQFLIRAWAYYEESTPRRALHSITRPSALRYNDLILAIRSDTENVRRNAAASSHAEFRVLHRKVDDANVQLISYLEDSRINQQSTQDQLQVIRTTIHELRQVMEFEKAVRAGDRIHIQSALSDIQLQQALGMVSSNCAIDHKITLHAALHLQKARQCRRSFRQPFWATAKLHEWNLSQKSSIILLRSTLRERNLVRGFCTDVVEYLVRTHTTVLWIFSSRDQQYPLLESLKSLVFQALSLSSAGQFAFKTSFHMNRFRDANFEEDYLNILADLLQSSKLVYIIAAIDAMPSGDAVQYRACLRQLSRILIDRGSKTVLKVITTSYGPQGQQANLENLVLTVGRADRRPMRNQDNSRSRRRGNQSVARFVETMARPDNP